MIWLTKIIYLAYKHQTPPPPRYLPLITVSFSSSLKAFAPCLNAWINTGTDCSLKSGAFRNLSMSSANSAVTRLM